MKSISHESEIRLRNSLTSAKQALDLRDANVAEECYHEIGGIVQSIDGYRVTPEKPGSLGSTWYAAHWYKGNHPKNDEYFPVLRGVVAAIEAWLENPVKTFETPSQVSLNRLQGCPFYRRELPVDNSLVFMLMPFTEPWSNRVWKKHIKPAVERVPQNPPLLPRRADDLFGEDVMTDVFESILRATLIIADITSRNANVFYELGLSHAMGKRVLLIAQGAEHIPFDLLRFRHVIYQDNSEGCEALEEAITKSVAEILRGNA